MDEFKKSPCGHISLCPCQTLRSNDIRMSFGLIKMVQWLPEQMECGNAQIGKSAVALWIPMTQK